MGACTLSSEIERKVIGDTNQTESPVMITMFSWEPHTLEKMKPYSFVLVSIMII